MACDYCQASFGHEKWCPLAMAMRDPGRPLPPDQPLAVEDWARGVLYALTVPATPEAIAIALPGMVALFRRAAVEGFALAHDQAQGAVATAVDTKEDPVKALTVTLNQGIVYLAQTGVVQPVLDVKG